MPLTADAAAIQVQDRLKNLQSLIHEIESERRRNEAIALGALDRLGAGEDQKPSNKIRSIFKTAMNDCCSEETLIRNALSQIQEIRNIRNDRRMQARNAGNKETIRRGALMIMLQISAQTLPLYVGRAGEDEKVPPLCGAIPAEPNYVAKPGDMVAALVKGTDEEENWILAEVVQILSNQKYEVDDIDEEQKEKHVISRRRIVPLPLMRANPETEPHALFPRGTVVMSLYPQTTCFYKAVINNLPTTATEDYEVLFEDSHYSAGYSPPLNVAQRYVISIKQNKKQA